MFTSFVIGLGFLLGTRVLAQVSPQTIVLTARALPAGASVRRRALDPTTIPFLDFFRGTDLQCALNDHL